MFSLKFNWIFISFINILIQSSSFDVKKQQLNVFFRTNKKHLMNFGKIENEIIQPAIFAFVWMAMICELNDFLNPSFKGFFPYFRSQMFNDLLFFQSYFVWCWWWWWWLLSSSSSSWQNGINEWYFLVFVFQFSTNLNLLPSSSSL